MNEPVRERSSVVILRVTSGQRLPQQLLVDFPEAYHHSETIAAAIPRRSVRPTGLPAASMTSSVE